MAIHNPVTLMGKDASGNSEVIGVANNAAHVTLRDTAGNAAGATNATTAQIAALVGTLTTADAGRTYRYTDGINIGNVVEWTGAAFQPVESTGAAHIDASPGRLRTITKSDATVYTPPLVAIRVGTLAGDVVVTDTLGNVITIPSVQVGEIVPGGFTKVMSTGTTATGITGWSRY